MSEAKFTKGDWIARGKTPSRIYAKVREDKEVIVAATGSVLNESGCNAHLIASAPRMYEMLVTLSSMMPMLDEQTHPAIEMDAIKSDIDNLLAEARGEK